MFNKTRQICQMLLCIGDSFRQHHRMDSLYVLHDDLAFGVVPGEVCRRTVDRDKTPKPCRPIRSVDEDVVTRNRPHRRLHPRPGSIQKSGLHDVRLYKRGIPFSRNMRRLGRANKLESAGLTVRNLSYFGVLSPGLLLVADMIQFVGADAEEFGNSRSDVRTRNGAIPPSTKGLLNPAVLCADGPISHPEIGFPLNDQV